MSKPPPPKITDLSALPDTSLVTLRGREAELARLDAAWDDPSIHVFSVVAWGGQGKTALVSTWADRLKAEGGRGAEALLAWSFYSQGSKERAASADRFLDWALKKLGLADPGPNATLKAEKIAEALQARRVLLVLDGVEPMQHGPGPQEGQLKDPALRALLRRVADAGSKGGLVLLTTRLAIKDIERWEGKEARKLDLSKLSDEAGAELLRDRKVKGPEKELLAAARDFGGHALALTLLSGFLVKRHGGDIHRRDCIGPMVAESGRDMDQVHGHARRVMKSMEEEWLSGAPLHAAIMRVVGLFDRPASGDCLKALRKPPALPESRLGRRLRATRVLRPFSSCAKPACCCARTSRHRRRSTRTRWRANGSARSSSGSTKPASRRRMAGSTSICAIRPRRAIRPRTSPGWSHCSRPLCTAARQGGSRRRSPMFIRTASAGAERTAAPPSMRKTRSARSAPVSRRSLGSSTSHLRHRTQD